MVYQDAQLIVVDKPAGLVVHHGAGHQRGHAGRRAARPFPELALLPAAGAGETGRPGIVHRLDKGTSGLMVVARTADAYASLSGPTAPAHRPAGTTGPSWPAPSRTSAGMVDAPIGRSPRQPTRMAVTRGGRPARTGLHGGGALRRASDEATLIEATLDTGRTHQVQGPSGGHRSPGGG